MQCEVTPNELTLAISIPTSREEFDRQLLEKNRYDYVASIAKRYPGLSHEGLWNLLAPTVRVCNHVAREAEALGVAVLKGFSSNHLEEILLGRRVATIVAHWRNVPIEPADIRDPTCLLSAIDEGNDRACEILRQVIADVKMDSPTLGPTNVLLAAMNRCVQYHHALSKGDASSKVADLSQRNGLTRVDIVERFSDYLIQSRDIELADGLSSVGEFVSLIPREFEGVLDLTICNSVILGSAVKRARPEITVVMNRNSASARNRLVLYLAILKELKRQPQLFGDAVIRARNIFRRMRK